MYIYTYITIVTIAPTYVPSLSSYDIIIEFNMQKNSKRQFIKENA